jgi:hypothetical protein
MKIRRIMIEIEVPYTVRHQVVLEVVRIALDNTPYSHQEQLVSQEISSNTKLASRRAARMMEEGLDVPTAVTARIRTLKENV